MPAKKSVRLRRVRLCRECDQPVVPKGDPRKKPDFYDHASGCPLGLVLSRPRRTRRKPSVEERFWAKVEKLPEAPGCWLWTGCLVWGYINLDKTHCYRGHEFTDENTYRRGHWRVCLLCQRSYRKDYYARNAA